MGALAWKSKICITLLLAHLKTKGWSEFGVKPFELQNERERGNSLALKGLYLGVG